MWMPAFVSNDGLPLGCFSKYTWHITNLMQVKRIFDTPEVNAHSLSLILSQTLRVYGFYIFSKVLLNSALALAFI